MRMRMLSTAAIVIVGTALALSPAMAAATKATVNMSSKMEVPPNDSGSSGKVDLTFDSATKTLTWKITATGLTGDPIAAHLHGPADAGANAGVLVNLAPNGAKLPIEGTAVLTDDQVSALTSGKTYINVHTPTNKGGEIRGQVSIK